MSLFAVTVFEKCRAAVPKDTRSWKNKNFTLRITFAVWVTVCICFGFVSEFNLKMNYRVYRALPLQQKFCCTVLP